MAVILSGNSANPGGEVPHIPTVPQEILSELGRATTAYYEALPDRLEQTRREYEEALRQFNATSDYSPL